MNPVREMFERICPRYDLLNHLLSFGLDYYWRRRAVASLGLGAGDRVVDLCCGTGDLSAELSRVVGSRSVVGVDFSPSMLERARHKYPALVFHEGDACQVPLESGTFQAATLAFGPRNIPDLQALWKEMCRLVVPGGLILSLELGRPRGLVGVLHRLYLERILPWLGGWISGDSEAYRYLSRTVAGFMEVEQVTESMRSAGLQNVRAIKLTGGIAMIHIGVRP